jgi:drug/metabolite transporter (DMT)-like permease
MSAVASYIFLGLVLTLNQYVGGALIILTVILVATRNDQSSTRSKADHFSEIAGSAFTGDFT